MMTEKVTQRQEVLDSLGRFLAFRRAEFGIVRIGIFGSAARDEIRDDSDVDIVVELDPPDLFALVGIQQELETLFRRTVDIVRRRQGMNAHLKQRIEQEAVYV